MHTNATLTPFRPHITSKRETNAAPADFDFTSATHAASVFGALSLESMLNGARNVELKTYSPRRCAPLILSPIPASLANASVSDESEGI